LEVVDQRDEPDAGNRGVTNDASYVSCRIGDLEWVAKKIT
jgi:hypothetical protein